MNVKEEILRLEREALADMIQQREDLDIAIEKLEYTLAHPHSIDWDAVYKEVNDWLKGFSDTLKAIKEKGE